jgi:hypothetical protein
MIKPGDLGGQAIATAALTKPTPKPPRRNSDPARTTKSQQQSAERDRGSMLRLYKLDMDV